MDKPEHGAEPVADTGNSEADRLISRLMSSDPEFDDCIDAAIFIRNLVHEHSGPDGFATWKDAAIAERMKRTAPPSGIAAAYWMEHAAKIAYEEAFKCQKQYDEALPGHGLPFVHLEVINAIRAAIPQVVK